MALLARVGHPHFLVLLPPMCFRQPAVAADDTDIDGRLAAYPADVSAKRLSFIRLCTLHSLASDSGIDRAVLIPSVLSYFVACLSAISATL